MGTRMKACGLASLPAAAAANGAMASAGLLIFGMHMWFAYVAATVIVEAALLGWWLKLGALRAIVTSLIANFVTGVLGMLLMCSGIVGSLTIPQSFSNWNPDPLAASFRAMLVYGLLSGVVEAAFWGWARSRDRRERLQALLPCLAVHVVSAVVGLGILLIPQHPYEVLAQYTDGYRTHEIARPFSDYVIHNEAIPPGKNMEEALAAIRRTGDWRPRDPSAGWTVGYVADWERFDRGEMRRHPREWNRGVAGKDVSDLPKGEVWLARWPGCRMVYADGAVHLRWDR